MSYTQASLVELKASPVRGRSLSEGAASTTYSRTSDLFNSDQELLGGL
jgi:hypothetical protein